MKPGDMFNAFQKKKHKALRSPEAVVSSEQNASHQFSKKKHKKSGASTASKTATRTSTSTVANPRGNITVTGGAGKGHTNVHIAMPAKKAKKHKMTQAQDDAYDKKHGIKEGSKEDIKQDEAHGIKDKKHAKKHKASKKCKSCGR